MASLALYVSWSKTLRKTCNCKKTEWVLLKACKLIEVQVLCQLHLKTVVFYSNDETNQGLDI